MVLVDLVCILQSNHILKFKTPLSGTDTGHINSCNHLKLLHYKILGVKSVKNVEMDKKDKCDVVSE